jgi:putative transposase
VALGSSLERFKNTVRCADLDEMDMSVAQRLWKYNHSRPDMALGGITPKQ